MGKQVSRISLSNNLIQLKKMLKSCFVAFCGVTWMINLDTPIEYGNYPISNFNTNGFKKNGHTDRQFESVFMALLCLICGLMGTAASSLVIVLGIQANSAMAASQMVPTTIFPLILFGGM